MENYPRSGSATAQHFFFLRLGQAGSASARPSVGPDPCGAGSRLEARRRPDSGSTRDRTQAAPVPASPTATIFSRAEARGRVCESLASTLFPTPVGSLPVSCLCAAGPALRGAAGPVGTLQGCQGPQTGPGNPSEIPSCPPPLMSLLLGLRLDPSVLAPKPSLGRPYCLFLWSRQTRRNHGGSPACAFTPFGITIEHAGCYFQPSC